MCLKSDRVRVRARVKPVVVDNLGLGHRRLLLLLLLLLGATARVAERRCSAPARCGGRKLRAAGLAAGLEALGKVGGRASCRLDEVTASHARRRRGANACPNTSNLALGGLEGRRLDRSHKLPAHHAASARRDVGTNDLVERLGCRRRNRDRRHHHLWLGACRPSARVDLEARCAVGGHRNGLCARIDTLVLGRAARAAVRGLGARIGARVGAVLRRVARRSKRHVGCSSCQKTGVGWLHIQSL